MDVTCVLWSCSLYLGAMVMWMPAGLFLRWQHGCFIISPWYSPPSLMPQPFLPSALQDIYELKDQIQDVEGRYMQGLKELKVEGLELTACLLLFSGSSMASLTPLPPHSYPSVPPPVAPNTTDVSLRAPSVNCVMIVLLHDLPSLPVLIQPAGCGLKWRHSRNSAGFKVTRRRAKMLHLLTDNSHAFNSEALLPPRLSLLRCWMADRLLQSLSAASRSLRKDTVCFIDRSSLLTHLTPVLFLVEFDTADAL